MRHRGCETILDGPNVDFTARMEGRLLLKNCSVLGPGGAVTRGQAVLVEGAMISRVGPDATIPALPGDWVVPAAGRLLIPGLVDCHTQLLASTLARGAPTPDEVAAVSGHCLALGLRHGITTHVEQLHAPAVVQAALGAQARIAQRLGARLIQSHASGSLSELEANAAAIREPKPELVRGSLGLINSSRCDDECLARAGRLREEQDCGVHLGLATSDEDLAVTSSRFGKPIAARFDAAGLLTSRTVGAIARALDGPGVLLAATRKCLLAPWCDDRHFETMLAAGVALGPATAGVRTLWSAVDGAQRVGRAHEVAWRMLFDGPARLVGEVFRARFGWIAPGVTADLALLDAIEPGDPIGWQQLPRAPVAWTIVGGRVVVREGQLVGADFAALAADAARAIEGIWARA